jgi:hypothetical protein
MKLSVAIAAGASRPGCTQAHENGFSFWERLLPPDLVYVPGLSDARELIASAFEPQNVE